MLNFKKITLEDQEIMTPRLQTLNCNLLNYSFAVQFLYRDILNFEYAFSQDFMVIKSTMGGKEFFMLPVGEDDLEGILNEIKEDAFTKGNILTFFQFCDENAIKLLKWADECVEKENLKYDFFPARDEFEYIYLSQQLISLEGHDLKSKRNHVNAFNKQYRWTSELITEKNLAEVTTFSETWNQEKEIPPCSKLNWENIALKEAFKHYFELKLQGLLIRVEEKVVAFAIGYPLNDDTYLVLFEKADYDYTGSYAMMNREFVKQFASHYLYVNRAEDAGVDGLRRAKLSYHPDYLSRVHYLEIRKN
ncbi:MAG: phosphatidylglycerol lysyltransferase domain-containing protein [Bacteroidales bacterium]